MTSEGKPRLSSSTDFQANSLHHRRRQDPFVRHSLHRLKSIASPPLRFWVILSEIEEFLPSLR